MNQSLDDFIQRKFSNRRRERGRSRSRRGPASSRNMKAQVPVPSRRSLANLNHIPDARFLIIQKKRQKMTDARDQLAQLARHSDLRSKLDRLRGDTRKDVMRHQGHLGITKQMAVNGELTLKTNRQPHYQLFTQSKDRLAVRGPLRRIVKNDMQDVFITGGTRQALAPAIQRTVWNDPSVPPDMKWAAPSYGSGHHSFHRTIRNDSFLPPHDTAAVFLSDDLARPSVKRSFNDIGLSSYQASMLPQSRYGWSRRRHDEAIVQDASSARLLSQREEWGRRNPAKRRPLIPVISSIEMEDSDDDTGPNGTVAPLRVSSELKARLDSSTNTSASGSAGYSGRVSSQSAASKSGHRIVVSNLHPTVIHEDIRELFEDVGTLLDSRLVRPGTAEVVYQHLQDAVKAVDLYHNRHLDGQPMKCLLVNSIMNKSTPSMRADSTSQLKLPTGTKSSIVPDVLTIHKALFNKS